MHPVDKARIIQEGMRAGEKMLQEEGMAALLPTTKTTKDKKRTADHGAIRIKTKNVNSIQIDQGDREEMVMNHMRQTQKNWDAWILGAITKERWWTSKLKKKVMRTTTTKKTSKAQKKN